MPYHIVIRFYKELNEFLPMSKRKVSFEHHFNQAGAVKDIIESLGVPHTEVDLIIVNGQSVTFDYKIKHGDDISVYPAFESFDISPITHLHPAPLRETKFVLDVHLGRLAAYLRMLGFDTLYQNNYDDIELANISVDEQRILLTYDKKLLMRKIITHGYYVRERQPKKQLLEIIKRFDLFNGFKPFTLCMSCNSEIKAVDKEKIKSHLMPRTENDYNEFWQCSTCKKVYWKGSHYQRMQEQIKLLKEQLQEAGTDQV